MGYSGPCGNQVITVHLSGRMALTTRGTSEGWRQSATMLCYAVCREESHNIAYSVSSYRSRMARSRAIRSLPLSRTKSVKGGRTGVPSMSIKTILRGRAVVLRNCRACSNSEVHHSLFK